MREHIQGAYFDVNGRDYHISLKKQILENIKQGNIVKGKIVYVSYDREEMEKHIQNDLFLSLLSKNDCNENFNDTKLIKTTNEVCIMISERLLNELIGTNSEDVEYRYNLRGDKMHFYTNENTGPFNEKSGFDNTFQIGLSLNIKQPTTGDLFESEYIHIE